MHTFQTIFGAVTPWQADYLTPSLRYVQKLHVGITGMISLINESKRISVQGVSITMVIYTYLFVWYNEIYQTKTP